MTMTITMTMTMPNLSAVALGLLEDCVALELFNCLESIIIDENFEELTTKFKQKKQLSHLLNVTGEDKLKMKTTK